MAELVVKAQCRSIIRQLIETTLNVTFPVWGIISPIAIFYFLMSTIAMYQQAQYVKAVETLAYLAILLCFSLTCLLLKRAVLRNFMIVNQQGIKLPWLLGSSIYFRPYIKWQDIQSIQATVSSTKLSQCKLAIYKKQGRSLQLPIKSLEPYFIEQLLLATHMWAPALCNPSLEELQNVLRIGAHKQLQASYTDLWEEELCRRFCPAAYITLEPGRVLRNNSLRVISHLASGGLSALYLCQFENKKLVVLKEAVIPEDSSENLKEKARELFEREAALLMKLDHSGIVRILDCFCEGGRNYMLLEYVNGLDLRQLVKQNGPQNEAEVLEWAIQIANALKYLHEREQPIIHRDLTPDNIVLRNDGQIVIVDLGAANEYIGNATGTFVGKNSFIAPEQLRGKATVQSDIYAFGCTLFFLLTGSDPEALSPSNPREFNSSVSQELAELVESCTQFEASDRYQSIAQLIPVLKRLAAQSLVV